MRTDMRTRAAQWKAAIACIGVLSMVVLAGCGGGDSEPAGPVALIAESVAEDVGKVMNVVESDSDQVVFVFEETHISPAGQIEIAIMLSRLLESHGMREIGLEGALRENDVLDAPWLGGPSYAPGEQIGLRENVIVQLLEDGEIGSAEMMALIYGDVRVTGIELSEELAVKLPETENDPFFIHLYEIAIANLSDDEIQAANELIDEGKEEEATDFILGTDDFVKEKYDVLFDPDLSLSCEELVTLADEVQAKAAEVGTELTTEARESLRDEEAFFQTCSDRSVTMVSNVLDLGAASPSGPVAMTIGAAHTARVESLLEDAGVSFAVIRAETFDQGGEAGDLSAQAFDRKLEAFSVDPAGSLGSFLDSRKKPPPVIGELWSESKAELFFLITSLARAASQGERPPFEGTLGGVLSQLQSVTVVGEEIRMDEKDLIFAAEALDNNGQETVLWVRARVDRDAALQTLQERLASGLSTVQEKDEPSREAEATEADPVLQRVSSDTIAKFSNTESTIINTTLGG